MHEAKLQAVDSPLFTDCHRNTMESLVASQKRWRNGVSISGVTRQESDGVILNYTLIQQTMTVIVAALCIELSSWEKKLFSASAYSGRQVTVYFIIIIVHFMCDGGGGVMVVHVYL